jgi:uncharacterized protein (TIGR03663 family)
MIPENTEKANKSAKIISFVAFFAAVAVAIFLRFYLLEIKPLHHDEGVNSHFLLALIREGKYKYDPANYHGPSLYYFTLLSVKLLGESEFALRFFPAICGVFTVILMWGLRSGLGLVGTPVAAWSLALSPGLVYFARDFIHESSFVFFMVGITVSAYHWKKPSSIFWLSIFSGLLLTTKETSIHTFLVLIAALVCAFIWFQIRNKVTGEISDAPKLNVAPLLYEGLQNAAIFFPIVITIYLILYTSFFTNPSGPLDFLKSVFQWTGRGFNEHIHDHVWSYYLGVLTKLELPLVVAGTIGFFITLWKGSRFGLFLMALAYGLVIGYSRIPYKTPWLMVSMITALAIFSGYVAQVIFDQLKMNTPRLIFVFLLLILITPIFWMSYTVNLKKYEDNNNESGYFAEFGREKKLTAYTDTQYGYVYAQTNETAKDLFTEINRINPDEIFYITRDYWPLPWYLRKYKVSGYEDQAPDNFEGKLLIGAKGQEEETMTKLKGNYVAKTYQLRPATELVLFIRQ